jgi:hypothetical protein
MDLLNKRDRIPSARVLQRCTNRARHLSTWAFLPSWEASGFLLHSLVMVMVLVTRTSGEGFHPTVCQLFLDRDQSSPRN